MKNKVKIFRGMNFTDEMERKISSYISRANKSGWKILLVQTETVLFGDRYDENFIRMPQHVFFTTTILLQKEE